MRKIIAITGIILALAFVPILLLSQTTQKSVMWDATTPPSGFQVPYYDTTAGKANWKSLSWTNLVNQPTIPDAVQVWEVANQVALDALTRNEGDMALRSDTQRVYVAKEDNSWHEIKRGKTYSVANAAALAAITSMVEGDTALQTDIATHHVYNGTQWVAIQRGLVYRHTSAAARASATGMVEGDVSYSTYENRWYIYDVGYGWQPLILDAAFVAYDNTTSLMVSTTVQAAIDELDARTDAYDFDTSSFSLSSTNGIYVHNDGDGNLFEIDKRASAVPVIDAGGYFSGANVEAIGQEIGDDLQDLQTALGISVDAQDFGTMPGDVLGDAADALTLFIQTDQELSKIPQVAAYSDVGEQGGFSFDGTDDYLDLGHSINTGLTTFAFELRTGALGQNDALLANHATDSLASYVVDFTGSNLRFYKTNGSQVLTDVATTPLLANTRYSIVCVDNGVTVKIYVDGKEKASANSSVTTNAATANHALGVYPNDNSGDWAGQIYSFRHWSVAKSAEDVLAIAQGYHDRTSLQIYYHPTSTTDWGWIDVSGNGKHARAVGATRIESLASRQYTGHQEIAAWKARDGGYYFDGTNDDFVATPAILFDDDFSFIVSADLGPTPAATQWIISSDGGGTSTRQFELYQNTDGTLAVQVGGANFYSVVGPRIIQSGHYVIAFAFDESAASGTLYLNGDKVPLSVAANTFTAMGSTAYAVRLGDPARASGDFTGPIREVQLFSKLLAADAIKKYSRGEPVANADKASLVAKYTAESATATLWEDVSGNERHAVNSNADLVRPALQESYILEQKSIAGKVGTGPGYYLGSGNSVEMSTSNIFNGATKGTFVFEIDDSRAVAFAYKTSGGASDDRILFQRNSGQYRVTLSDRSAGDDVIYITYPQVGRAVHCIVFDAADKIIYYINGKKIAETSVVNAVGAALQYSTANQFESSEGLIVHGHQYFNRVLTAHEIEQVSNGQYLGFADYGASGAASYTSDFSVDANGWANNAKATVTGNIDAIGGQDDVLEIKATSDAGVHIAQKLNFLSVGKRYRIKIDYRVPSTNSHCDGFILTANSNSVGVILNATSPNTDQWLTYEGEFIAIGDDLFIYMTDGGAVTFTDSSADDAIHVKSIVITPIGLVLDLNENGITSGKWYDDSGNNYDGTVTGATAINMNHHWQGIEAQADGDVIIESDLVVTDTTTLSTVSQDNALTKVLVLDGTDVVKWRDVSTINAGADGDNLGNHTATTTLNMATNNITNVGDIHVGGDLFDSLDNAGTNGQFLGKDAGALKWLTLSGADNLGNHTATQTLWMQSNSITNVATIDVTTLLDRTDGLGGERQYLGANSSGQTEWKPLSTVWDSTGASYSGWVAPDNFEVSLAVGVTNVLAEFEYNKIGLQLSGANQVRMQVDDLGHTLSHVSADTTALTVRQDLINMSISGVNTGQAYLDRDVFGLAGVNLDLNNNDLLEVDLLDLDGFIQDDLESTGSLDDVLMRGATGVIWEKPSFVWSPNETHKAGYTSDTVWSISYSATPYLTVTSSTATFDTATIDFTGGTVNNVGPIELDGTLIDINGQAGTNGQVLSTTGTGVDWIDIPASGEVNTASNIGTGEGVFASKVGSDLRFKKIAAGTGIYVTSTADTITIDNVGGSASTVNWRIGDNTSWANALAKVTTAGDGTTTPFATGDVDLYVQDGDQVKDGFELSFKAVTVHSNADDAAPGVTPDPAYSGANPINTLSHPLEVHKGDIIVGDQVGFGYGLVLPVQETDGSPSGDYYRVILRRTVNGDPNSATLMIEPYRATQIP